MSGVQLKEVDNIATKDRPTIPESWRWSSVDELVYIIDYRGRTPPYSESGIPHLRSANIKNGIIVWDKLSYLSEADYEKYMTRGLPKKGDVLFTTEAPLGEVAMAPSSKFSLAQRLLLLRALDNFLIPKFLAFQLMAPYFQSLLRFRGTGSTVTGISSRNFRVLPLSVAPINEQCRIVAKIEELYSDLDAGVAALQRAKANLKRYRAAVLKAAVEGKLTEAWRAKHPNTEPASKLLERILTERRQKWEADQLAKFAAAGKQPPKNWREKYVEPSPPETNGLPELPKGWTWCTASQICETVASGNTPSPDRMYENQGDIPFLKVYNLTFSGSLDFTIKPTFIDIETHKKQARSCVCPGDVLINIVGPPLGKVSIVPSDFPEWNINQAIVVFRPTSGMVNWYLAIAMMTDSVMRRVTSLAKATAGQFNIGVSMCRDLLPIPLPPLNEQQQIVEEVSEKLSQIEVAETAITRDLLRATRLRQSILKQAFEGKLVPQDPSDEQARVMLEQIGLEKSKMVNGRPAKRRKEMAK